MRWIAVGFGWRLGKLLLMLMLMLVGIAATVAV
jgi:hypothetical protein